jgi:hypothetical protein
LNSRKKHKKHKKEQRLFFPFRDFCAFCGYSKLDISCPSSSRMRGGILIDCAST